MATICHYFCIKKLIFLVNIFLIYLSQNFSKTYSKTHQIAPFIKKNSEAHAPKPPARNSPNQTQKKFPPPLANPAYAHALYIKSVVNYDCNCNSTNVCCVVLLHFIITLNITFLNNTSILPLCDAVVNVLSHHCKY